MKSPLISTLVEDYRKPYGLMVKREDLCCPEPGPPFSKMRGVIEHLRNRPEKHIGVLDTSHSQAGHAVAYACKLLGKKCINFFPVYTADVAEGKLLSSVPLRPQQLAAKKLGARMEPLAAWRSAILFHRARKILAERHPTQSYMMPNALKLPETVSETAREVHRIKSSLFWAYVRQGCPVIIPCSSGTIAAGVIEGMATFGDGRVNANIILHMGYVRSEEQLKTYITSRLSKRVNPSNWTIIDENYSYKDRARGGVNSHTPSFPCNEYYDLKAFRWWMERGMDEFGPIGIFWNVG